MGMDMTMPIIGADGTVYTKDYNDGNRDYDWFEDLRDRGADEEYNYFPNRYGVPKKLTLPDDIANTINNAEEYGYFDINYVIVSEFKEWFEKYRPDRDAFWMSTKDKWLYENKHFYNPDRWYNIMPDESEIPRADIQFVEIEDIYNPSKKLYDYLKENNIPDDAYIIYYFDC